MPCGYRVRSLQTAGISCAEGYDSWEYLQKLVWDGFYERYPQADEKLKERVSYELNTIKTMGFVDYFLIVWDFIHYAKEHDIMVGPGRGSAAGSIVSYCLILQPWIRFATIYSLSDS